MSNENFIKLLLIPLLAILENDFSHRDEALNNLLAFIIDLLSLFHSIMSLQFILPINSIF